MEPMNPKGLKLPRESHARGRERLNPDKKIDLNPHPARDCTQFSHLLDQDAGETEPRQ